MLSVSSLILLAGGAPGENPLPFFRQFPCHREVCTDGTLLPRDMHLLGHETAPRILPYRVQDQYERARREREVRTVVLENEHLKAVFLPEWGGRLYSLYSKSLGRELLFCNPVLQPANLAILNAWCSGGIEWNVGQYGHAFSTASPVFCARVRDAGGADFLRIYEYERTHHLFWQLDVHLPPGSSTLNVYVRILNDRSEPSSLYYWTNIALPEAAETRVFGATDEVLYLDGNTGILGRGRLPHLPTLPGEDASYPQRFYSSQEYFFQTDNTEPAPWEAAAQPDGTLFFERSTQPLRYRKMFCWGMQPGGRHWKEFLSQPGGGSYVEIQAGLAPTQLHGEVLKAGACVEFAQCFGAVETPDAAALATDWAPARAEAQRVVETALPAAAVAERFEAMRACADAPPVELLSHGSGFGALEVARRQSAGEAGPPAGFAFPQDTLGEAQQPWLQLLRQGRYPREYADVPPSYMTGHAWETLLSRSLEQDPAAGPEAWLQYGVMLAERGETGAARDAFDRAVAQCSGQAHCAKAIALRCTALLQEGCGEVEAALHGYHLALREATGATHEPILREYFAMLARHGRYEELWTLYEGLPQVLRRDERILLPAAEAALAMERLDFVERALDRDFVYVRESATQLSDLWVGMYRLRMEKTLGRAVSAAEAEKAYPVPFRLDFRMK